MWNLSERDIEVLSSVTECAVDDFNKHVLRLLNGLRALWYNFDESLESFALPRGLQTLIFGGDFNQSLEIVDLPVLFLYFSLPWSATGRECTNILFFVGFDYRTSRYLNRYFRDSFPYRL